MPMLLTDMARSVGATLGRITRQFNVCGSDARRTRRYMPSNLGATEDQVNMSATVPERIDAVGTKVEDLAGTGVQDAPGG